jgi:outer membrane protein OmpA-like peptidoglycan-associated protein
MKKIVLNMKTDILQINKSLLVLLLLWLGFPACGVSQSRYHNKPESAKVQSLFREAAQYYDIRDNENALELIDKCLKKDPWFLEAWDLKGQILLADSQYHQALKLYEEISRKDPGFRFAWLEMAHISFELLKYDDAYTYAQEALKQMGTTDGAEKRRAQRIAENANFARNAIKHPVDYSPHNLGPEVNSVLEEYHPGLTVDGKYLFYTRRDGRVSVYEQNEDIYQSERQEGTFKKSKNLGGPINSMENEGAFSTSADGQYLFFTACNRPGGVGSCDIWLALRKGDQWDGPFNLGKPLNSRDWDAQPSLTADGATLYFVSSRPGGYGGSDIWKSTFGEKGWSLPENLGPDINTPDDEQFPFIHPDGQTLYFSSSGYPGMGKNDFYFSRLQEDGKWTNPVNLGYPINTPGDEWNLIVNRTGDTAFLASNGIDGGYGGMDLYSFALPLHARPKKVNYVKGIIIDDASNTPLKARVTLKGLSTGKTYLSTNSNAKSGAFLATLKGGQSYAMDVSAEGYLFHSEHFEIKEESSLEDPFIVEVRLKKISPGQTIVLKNIFFDTDKYDLKKESTAELETLLSLLKRQLEMHIEIGGHTDNQGSEEHNLVLSKNRAKAVYDYLVANGIESSRLSYKGYGSRAPIESNDSEEGRANNRRTEIKIVK